MSSVNETRLGWAVQLFRQDKSTWLACSGNGLLPAVFMKRKYAVAHKQKLVAYGFKGRVVRVRFSNVEVVS